MESRLPKIKSIGKQTANWVIRIVGSLILLFLVWYAMRTTQYMIPLSGHEDLVEIQDSVLQNLAAAVLVLMCFQEQEERLQQPSACSGRESQDYAGCWRWTER